MQVEALRPPFRAGDIIAGRLSRGGRIRGGGRPGSGAWPPAAFLPSASRSHRVHADGQGGAAGWPLPVESPTPGREVSRTLCMHEPERAHPPCLLTKGRVPAPGGQVRWLW